MAEENTTAAQLSGLFVLKPSDEEGAPGTSLNFLDFMVSWFHDMVLF